MGLLPLEAPLSALCRTEAFAWFACAVLAELPRFHGAYNDAIATYRTRHDLRSRNHPAPDLGKRANYWEAPFWAWRHGGQRRHRLFVGVDERGASLRADEEDLGRLDGDPRGWVERWADFEKRGIKIRTRALTTTLFTRLFLADLFLHGIGGGKYDEVTDTILASFFGPVPRYLVVTATLHLPLPRYPDADVRAAELARLSRDLVCNPQRHLSESSTPLVQEKRRAIEMPQETHLQRVERFQRLHELTQNMAPLVAARMREVDREAERSTANAGRDRIATRRDYAFPLYPEAMLRGFFANPLFV